VRGSGARLRRTERLRDAKDYRRVNDAARRAASANFVILVTRRPRELDAARGPRLGITASRRLGGAVERNRVKRRIREWFRNSKTDFGLDTDVVVIARAGATRLSQQQLECELAELSVRAGQE
jgi:ribonuclease P protein component